VEKQMMCKSKYILSDQLMWCNIVNAYLQFFSHSLASIFKLSKCF